MEILRVVLDVIEGDTIKLVSIKHRIDDSIDPSTQSETAQAGPETYTASSYGETVKLDRNSPEFAARKEELKKLGYKWDRKEKVWRKPTNANGPPTPAPAAQADWYGDATEIQLSSDDPEFNRKKESLKSAGFRWDPTAKVWRLPGK